MTKFKNISLSTHNDNFNHFVSVRSTPVKLLKAKRIATDMTINMVAIVAIAMVGFATLQTILA